MARRGGGEAYRERCEALAASLGHADAVTFEGRVDDIKYAYAAGNVVMLSSISEGFPFTLIEAMSCGRATVSTDVGGVREAVGDTGFVVPHRSTGTGCDGVSVAVHPYPAGEGGGAAVGEHLARVVLDGARS